jgi:hypothetical protein
VLPQHGEKRLCLNPGGFGEPEVLALRRALVRDFSERSLMSHQNFSERRAAMSRLVKAGVEPKGDLLKKLSIAFACHPKTCAGSRMIQLAPPLRGVSEDGLNKATQKLARSVPRLCRAVCAWISYFSPPPFHAMRWLSPLVPSNKEPTVEAITEFLKWKGAQVEIILALSELQSAGHLDRIRKEVLSA